MPWMKLQNPTNAFGHVDHLGEFLLLGQFFQTPVDETDRRDSLDDFLILQDQVQMDRLGKNGMLGTEWDDGLFAHVI